MQTTIIRNQNTLKTDGNIYMQKKAQLIKFKNLNNKIKKKSTNSKGMSS